MDNDYTMDNDYFDYLGIVQLHIYLMGNDCLEYMGFVQLHRYMSEVMITLVTACIGIVQLQGNEYQFSLLKKFKLNCTICQKSPINNVLSWLTLKNVDKMSAFIFYNISSQLYFL